MSSNPFLSQWLSAAHTAAGTWRGFWTAEFARQQAVLAGEWQRQALRFWTQAMTGAAAAAPSLTEAPATSAPEMPAAASAAADAKPAPEPLPVAAAARAKAPAKRAPARSASRRGSATTRP